MITTSSVIQTPRQILLNGAPPQTPVDQPHITRHKRDVAAASDPDENTRAGGDSALAVIFAKAMRQGASDSGYPESIENIPKTSTFGEWWSHLHTALKSPPFLEWARSKGINLSKPIEINPGRDTISFTAGGKLQTFWGPDQGDIWASVTGPIMKAAEVLSPEGKALDIESPNSMSATYITVAHFYGEYNNRQTIEAIEARAKELEHTMAFPELAMKHYSAFHEVRSEDAPDKQKAVLGNNNTRYYAASEFKHLATLMESGDVPDELILDHLKKNKVQIDPHNTHSKDNVNTWGETSLNQYLEQNGWDIPTNRKEVENLTAALLSPELKSPLHGNYGGALSWPIPLDNTSHLQLIAAIRHGKIGNIDLSSFKTVLEYLMHGSVFEPSELRHPQRVIDRLIQSPKGQALGKAIQASFEAKSVKGSAHDWLLAALSLDRHSPVPASKGYVAGYVLTGPDSYGKSASTIVQGLAHEITVNGTASSPEKASIQAHLLLSSQAPEFLVKNIPDRVNFGSHSWVSFVTAVGRLEANAPGSTATMTYADVMLQAAIAPISAKERHIEYVAQQDALKDWGAANGLPYPQTDAQMTTVRNAFNAQISELKAASEAQSTPMPMAREMALEQLKKALPDMAPALFDKKCITLEPSVADFPGPYSILDLYLDGRSASGAPTAQPDDFYRALFTNGQDASPSHFVSSSTDVNISEVLQTIKELPHISTELKKSFLAYLVPMEKSIATQVKHLISQQPIKIRNNFEFGKITIVREDTVDYAPLSLIPSTRARANNNLLVKTERNGQIHTYEVNLKQGRIVERTDLGDFRPGKFPLNHTHPSRSLAEVTPSGQYTADLTDEKVGASAIPNSFSSERTSYIADAFVKDINIQALEAEAKGLTTFDTEEPFYKKAHEFMLNLIPLRSAIINFQKGNIGEGIVDLSLDIFGFVVGAGAAAKGAKALSVGASAFSKVLQGTKIVGRAAIGSLNPLSGIDDLFRLAKQGLVATRNTFTQLYKGLTTVDLLSLAKKPSIAEGTLKAVNGVDDIKVFAKLDEATGNWHAIDLQTRKPYGKPLENFQPKVLSSDELKGNIESLYKSLDGKSELDICYATALRTAQADKKIAEKTFKTIIPEVLNGGTPRYNELMNIKPDTLKDTFSATDITESGIVTFVSKKGYNEGKITHAVYIQRTGNGELHLYHSNSHALDSHLGGLTTQPATAGKANVYKLGSEQAAGIQDFMGSGPGYSMVFSPASSLNARVTALAK